MNTNATIFMHSSEGWQLLFRLIYKNNIEMMKLFKTWTVINLDLNYYSKFYNEKF